MSCTRCWQKKKRALEESKEAAALLEARLAGRAVEEPVRKMRLEDLQQRLQQADVPQTQRAVREVNLLRREKAQLEDKIYALNEANLGLADQHRQERNRVAEKQQKLRIQGKRERELAKQLDSIARAFSDASAATRAGTSAKPVDYRCLPGLCVAKLVGKTLNRDPPTLRASELGLAAGMSMAPSAAPSDVSPTALR